MNEKFIILIVVFVISLCLYAALFNRKGEDDHKWLNLLKSIIGALITTCVLTFIVPSIHFLDILPNRQSEAGTSTTLNQDEFQGDNSSSDNYLQEDYTQPTDHDSYDSPGHDDAPSGEEAKEDLFSMAFLSTDSNDMYDSIVFDLWDSDVHKDLRGESYEETKNYYLSISNIFNDFTNYSSPLTADIHLTLNPDCKGDKHFSGDIVVESQSAGSTSSAEVTILVDDELAWTCPETMTGTTIEPQHFDLELTNAENEVIIRVKSKIAQGGINLGFVNLVDEVI